MTNIQSANLPFLNLQSKKNFSSNQNSNNKIPLANVSAKINVPYSGELSPKAKAAKTNITNISSIKNEGGAKQSKKSSDEAEGDAEYKLCLQQALQEAINENDFLREEIKKITEKNKELQRDLEEKENAIVELAKYYEYCKEHHQQEEDSDEDGSKEGKGKRKKSY